MLVYVRLETAVSSGDTVASGLRFVDCWEGPSEDARGGKDFAELSEVPCTILDHGTEVFTRFVLWRPEPVGVILSGITTHS